MELSQFFFCPSAYLFPPSSDCGELSTWWKQLKRMSSIPSPAWLERAQEMGQGLRPRGGGGGIEQGPGFGGGDGRVISQLGKQGWAFSSLLPYIHGSVVLLCTELEWKISESGAIKTDLEENPRKQIQDQLMSSIRTCVPARGESDSEDD